MVRKTQTNAVAAPRWQEIIFYIEGGRSKTADVEFRQAFHQFFVRIETEAKIKNIRMRIVLEGSRKKTYDRFSENIGRKSGVLSLLLVDAEVSVTAFDKPWKHLAERQDDSWAQPAGADDEHCHLMAQAMEAWFFADPDALVEFYGNGFLKIALPKRRNVEEIPKDQHIGSLERATKRTSKKTYDKFTHGPKLLMRIKPEKVRARAPHCDRIFVEVGKLIGANDL